MAGISHIGELDRGRCRAGEIECALDQASPPSMPSLEVQAAAIAGIDLDLAAGRSSLPSPLPSVQLPAKVSRCRCCWCRLRHRSCRQKCRHATPTPPLSVSLPSPPLSVSAPSPPLTTSLPPAPLTMSLPPSPLIVLAAAVPLIVLRGVGAVDRRCRGRRQREVGDDRCALLTAIDLDRALNCRGRPFSRMVMTVFAAGPRLSITRVAKLPP